MSTPIKPRAWAIGDRVKWTHEAEENGNIRMTTRTGVIEKLHLDGSAIITKPNGRPIKVAQRRLRASK